MSLELPLTESDDDDMGEVFVGEEHQDDESEDELAEVFEIQKRQNVTSRKLQDLQGYQEESQGDKEITCWSFVLSSSCDAP